MFTRLRRPTRKDAYMTILGVTGGIGSGKSTVCKVLENRGARVFYADDVAKQLMAADSAVKAKIIEAFGKESYDEDGMLDRAYLAKRIFSSDEDRMVINSAVHPAVDQAFELFAEKAEKEGVRILVKEAALLLETNTESLDYVIVVDAPAEERIRRVIARDGGSEQGVLARMRGQQSASDMRAQAGYIIENTGTETDLENSVDEMIEELVA